MSTDRFETAQNCTDSSKNKSMYFSHATRKKSSSFLKIKKEITLDKVHMT